LDHQVLVDGLFIHFPAFPQAVKEKEEICGSEAYAIWEKPRMQAVPFEK
jgi:hypothetical protein